MYKEINVKENIAKAEDRIKKYWKKNNIPEKSISTREGQEKFVFFEGPPTANGKPGIHHVIARTLKDTVCRYKTMKGYQVKRKAGWDTHGLPVEIEVEKQLDLHDKNDIIEYGIEKFNKKCKESVFSYEKEWREMTKKMGYWVDMKNPYITLKNEYIETVWWILNNFWEKDLIYKGHKIVPYCPSCGTPLSSHEVAQGYEETHDPSIFIKFKVKEEENTYFLAWTTTPWTLISNVALAVHPDEKYVKIKLGEEFFILAKGRLGVIEDDYSIVEEYTGKDLEFKEYEPLFSYVDVEKKAYYVGLADYVVMTEGTGIVHTAPAFGEDDYQLRKKYDLPIIQPVDESGKFEEAVTDWAGKFVKDADKSIIRNLKERGLLYKRKNIIHSYPFCWRCDSPLIYFARSSWYIKTQQYKQKMLVNNKKINWYPDYVGEKRFGEWLENNVDWALSRDRFWGTPLNIWICEECKHMISIGSIAELKEKGKMSNGEEVPQDIELHRPYVDEVEITCSKCNGVMKRTEEVIDCWFDSGSMPFAQWHYPFENKDKFAKELFPADFICEGIDQTRGWFYSLLAISTILRGENSYKNVLVNDLILDKNGIKMSKSKGNTVEPNNLLNKYGADANRWYLMAVSPPWIPTKFNENEVKDIVNKLIGTLKNVYSFFATYANIDKFNAEEYEFNFRKENKIDIWILSKLHSLIKKVNNNMEKYDLTRSVRAIQSFVVDDLSNWYVRRSRRRFWSFELNEDKKEAYLTLHYTLKTVTKLMAPFAPFITEDLYRNLTNKESVHLTDFPQSKTDLIDSDLERKMETVIKIVSLGRAARNSAQIKVRQTLSKIYIPLKFKQIVEPMKSLIMEEINIKEIDYCETIEKFVKYSVKLNYKVAGPKFGKHVKHIAEAIKNIDGTHLVKKIKAEKEYYFELDGGTFKITEADLDITLLSKENYEIEQDDVFFVVLSTELDKQLIQEGLAREMINKIQYTRKEKDFEIMDRIKIFYNAGEEIKNMIIKYNDYIKNETLTENIYETDTPKKDMEKWDINGREVYFTIEKIT